MATNMMFVSCPTQDVNQDPVDNVALMSAMEQVSTDNITYSNGPEYRSQDDQSLGQCFQYFFIVDDTQLDNAVSSYQSWNAIYQWGGVAAAYRVVQLTRNG